MSHKYAALRRAQLHLDFIHANSTTHSFLFGALAELLDNARDSGAARLDVFSVDNEKLQGGFMLCFLDDGCGMSPEEASDIIYFGTSKKRLSTLKFIGQYGNGLKSGSMRIGKDFILFTKKEETMTCVFFSQTFCEGEGLSEVVVPMPSWLTRTRESVTDDPQKFSTELSIIYKYSPFKNEAELMQQFDVIYGKCGTLLVIYNLKLLLSGEPELDVKTDKEDILMAGADEEKYLYVTCSFKGTLKNEVKKAEEAVKIGNRNLTSFWNEFGYQHSKDMETSLDSLQYQRRQAMAIPFMVQCDLCLKWRVLPSSMNYQEKEFHDMWICANNPNLLENSCRQVERLPSIPLGTMSTVLPSKNEKEKQLRESVLRYQNKLAEQQSQLRFIPASRIAEFTPTCLTSTLKENTKTQKIRPSGVDLKHESLSPIELSVGQRSQKRNTEHTDSDVEYVSDYKIMKKSVQKKMKPLQQRHVVPENIQLAERPQASSGEMKRKQSLNLTQECKVLSEIQTSDSDPDIILVLDKSSTDVSLKQEQKEVPLINEEKQELCSDTPAIKRNSSFPNQE
ncbi:Hypothetical predicted protein, partial [Marmota monax]